METNFKLRVPSLLKSTKSWLTFVNTVFLITGLLLLFVGIVVQGRFTGYDVLFRSSYFFIPWFVIGTGITILLGSILGLRAAVSKCPCPLATYILLQVVVLGCEIAIISVAYALYYEYLSGFSLWNSVQEYGTNSYTTIALDQLHQQFTCCGSSSSSDWLSPQLPISCCYIPPGAMSPFECDASNAFYRGCARPFGVYLSQQAYTIAMTAAVVIGIQVILIVITSVVASWIRRGRHGEDKRHILEPEIPSPEPAGPGYLTRETDLPVKKQGAI